METLLVIFIIGLLLGWMFGMQKVFRDEYEDYKKREEIKKKVEAWRKR